MVLAPGAAQTSKTVLPGLGDAAWVAKQLALSWMKKDPIPRFEGVLKEMGVLDDAKIAAIKKEIGAEVEAAVKFAEESPLPDLAEVLTDVYTVG